MTGSDIRHFASETMRHPVTVSFLGGRAAIFSTRAPDKTDEASEDGAVLIPLDRFSGVLAVADGLGGIPRGEDASRRALDALAASAVLGFRRGLTIRSSVLNGFDEANRAVLAMGVGGTTLTAAEIHGPTLRCYNVGDSGALVVGRGGRLKFQSTFHSPVGYAVEAGLLDEHDALLHEDRHLVSNMVGSADMRIEIGPPIDLRKTDTVVLGSDGLFDNLKVREIVDRLRRGSLEESVMRAADECLRRMCEPVEGRPSNSDDLTIVAFRPER
jgi:serine/threonine protein phosphatase PrpC